jgi:hypothetical protein
MCSVGHLMPVAISVTFRDQTTGRINDLLMDEHRACAQSQNLLGYLAGALLNYKDEGTSSHRRSCFAMLFRIF